MGIVDPVLFSRLVFHVGIDANLHGGRTYPGQLALDDHHFILISAVEEGQVVHGGGGHITHGVPFGDNPCHFVDPLHQDAAKEAVGAVEMVGAHQVDRFHPGFVYGFSVHSPILLSVLFALLYHRKGKKQEYHPQRDGIFPGDKAKQEPLMRKNNHFCEYNVQPGFQSGRLCDIVFTNYSHK